MGLGNKQYPWSRFWIPRGEHWANDGGFLSDPEAEDGPIYSNSAISLSNVRNKSVLILLGEVGIGKSTAIAAEASIAEQAAKLNQHLFLSINLNQYADEGRLVEELFGSDPFVSYFSGTKPLHLLLDSFDECRLGIPHLSTILCDQLKKRVIAPERLFLRIASRSGDWPNSLEQVLREIWCDNDGSSVGVLELCPLRRHDAEVAANTEGLDGKAFLKVVGEREVESLACRPKTLRFLLQEFKREQDFPRRKVELYEKGCLYLCEEDSRRIEAGRGGYLTSQQKFRIASRIAVSLMVGNRAAVWLGNGIDKSGDDIGLSDLVSEIVYEDDVLIDSKVLVETLVQTGLFRQVGPQRLRFDHQSDAEFLAARYLANSGMSVQQMLMLISHPEDGRLVPQLYEMAAWLASMNKHVFDHILKIDPAVLLASDVAVADIEAKHRLVERLLALYQAGESFDRLRYAQLHKLSHQGLIDQLLPYIKKKSYKFLARELAIDIAMACNVPALQDAILRLAKDKREDYYLRINALEAISEIGGSNSRQELRPFILGEMGEDPDDRLKGFALKAMWPEYLSSKELFQYITPKKREYHSGIYDHFVRNLAANIHPENLVDALHWVERQSPSSRMDFTIREFENDLMRVAWDYFEVAGVPQAFARAAYSRLREHDGLFEHGGKRDDRDRLSEIGKRRQLLIEMISLLEEKDIYLLAWHVAKKDDARWLLEIYKSTSYQQRIKIASMLANIINIDTPTDLVCSILDICGCHVKDADLILRKAMRWLTHPMRLKSKNVQETRSHWSRQRKTQERNNQRVSKPSPTKLVAKSLDRFEAGDLNAWPRLALDLTLEVNGRYKWPGKLFDKPGWIKADEITRQRILCAGLAYIRGSTPDIESLFEKTSYTASDFAGIFSFQLLASVAPEKLLDLTINDWGRWAPLIVMYFYEDQVIRENLFRLASGSASAEFLRAIERRIDSKKKTDGLNLSDFDCIWSEQLGKMLFEKLSDSAFSLKARCQLFEFLLRHKFDMVYAHLRNVTRPGGSVEERTLATALLLIWDQSNRSKDIVELLGGDQKFACKVFIDLASRIRYEGGDNLFFISEDLSADLYIWLEKNFSKTKNLKNKSTYAPRDQVDDFKNNMFAQLRSKGTIGACDAMKKIVAAFPGRDWFKYVLQEMEKNTRMATWTAPGPGVIFSMAANKKARLVRSDSELLDAILDSLRGLQISLKGETPLAPFLWNEISARKNTYKNENRLSDFIKYHLKQDLNQRGVLVSREVEVHNWPGKGRGKSVDLMVQSQLPNQMPLTVVIEVKGCWNRDWLDGMAKLKDEYLLTPGHRCGIHLVGWYGQNQCQKRMGFMEMSRLLEQKANDLSKDGIKISSFPLDVSFVGHSKPSSKKAIKKGSMKPGSRR